MIENSHTDEKIARDLVNEARYSVTVIGDYNVVEPLRHILFMNYRDEMKSKGIKFVSGGVGVEYPSNSKVGLTSSLSRRKQVDELMVKAIAKYVQEGHSVPHVNKKVRSELKL